MKSDTPRTDEYACKCSKTGTRMSPNIHADFARTLERELSTAKAEVERLKIQIAATPVDLSDIHACQKCGMPGAVMYWPGGYLCEGGCKKIL